MWEYSQPPEYVAPEHPITVIYTRVVFDWSDCRLID
jgi:hypothetical protein